MVDGYDQGQSRTAGDPVGEEPDLTLPIPAIKLAQGLEVSTPKPEKAPSSKKGESGSRRSAILSRAGKF